MRFGTKIVILKNSLRYYLSAEIDMLWILCTLAAVICEKKKKKNPGKNHLGSVWYMCLKTEKCCLKIFVKIRVGEKVRWNAWNVV